MKLKDLQLVGQKIGRVFAFLSLQIVCQCRRNVQANEAERFTTCGSENWEGLWVGGRMKACLVVRLYVGELWPIL